MTTPHCTAVITLLALLLLLPLLPPVAAAQDDAAGRVHFQAGSQYFDVGDYERAAAEFERAYELSGHAALLYNIYSSYERAGELEPAASALTRYLAEEELDADRHDALSRRLESLRARIAERADADAPQPPPGEPPDAEGPASSGIPLGGWIAISVAAVAAASFGVFAILSETEYDALADDCGRDAGRSCSADRVGNLDTYNVVADVSLGVAAAAGITALIVLVASGGSEGREPGSAALVVPALGPRGAGVRAEVAF